MIKRQDEEAVRKLIKQEEKELALKAMAIKEKQEKAKPNEKELKALL